MKRYVMAIITGGIMAVLATMMYSVIALHLAYKQQSFTEFMNVINSDRIQNIEYIHNYESENTLRYKIGNEQYAVEYPSLYLSFNSQIIDRLSEHGIEMEFKIDPVRQLRSTGSNLVTILFIILLLSLIRHFVLVRHEDIYVQKAINVDTKFDDIAGYKHVKEELQKFVDMLKNPGSYSKYHVDIPKGILLQGPPGNGKTLCARAIAGESDTPFFHISASQIENKYVGSGSRRLEKVIKDVKKQSKKYGKAILFIDEIDAIGISREKRTVVETNQTLNTLLTAMDGFDKDDHILFIAATNLADKLDPALVRSGRFDKFITVPLPNYEDRRSILQLYLDKKRDIIDPKVYEENFVDILARQTAGKCAADLRQIINEACSMAHTKKSETVDIACLREALIKTTVGMETDVRVNEEERRIVAYHEAGHAAVQCLIDPRGPESIAYITTKPYAKSLGHVSVINQDRVLMKKSDIHNMVKMLLAGRVVEEKLLAGDYTSGAANDIQRVNQVLFTYVTKYGMSEDVKNLFMEQPDEKDEYVRTQIEKIREELYKQTEQLVHEHFGLVERIGNYLIEHEVMEQQDLIRIFNEYKKERMSA